MPNTTIDPLTHFSTTHQHTVANKSLEENSIFRSQYHIKPAHNTEETPKLINAYFEYITGEHNDRRKTFHKTKQRLKLKTRTHRKRFLVQLLYDNLQVSLRYIEVDI